MNKRQEIEEQIQRLQKELAELPHAPNWDEMSGGQLRELLFQEDMDEWNDWEVCPVGSLVGSSHGPKDRILFHLGLLTGYAVQGNWINFIYNVRKAARERIEELDKQGKSY